MKRLFIIGLLLLGARGLVSATESETVQGFLKGDSIVTEMRCAEIAPSYEVNADLLENENAYKAWIAQWGDNYTLAAAQCEAQSKAMGKMHNSLENDFEHRDGQIWIDSSTVLVDGEVFMTQLSKVQEFLANQAKEFIAKEKARQEAIREAERARAKAEAERKQGLLDNQLAQIKDSITLMHRQITFTCDGNGISDKGRIKELKDLHYAYLSIYNKQSFNDTKATPEIIDSYRSILDFQQIMMDSVLGANSYTNRIEGFKEELKSRCGKEYTDVNKSYLKVFKKTQVPVVFSTLEEFDQYVHKLRDIIVVQQSYITTIEKRTLINTKSQELITRCSKQYKDVATAYKEMVENTNFTPSQSSIIEAEAFLAKLDEFIAVQDAYFTTIARIEAIDQHGQNFITACGKSNSDLSSAYKNLVANTNFVPTFATLSGAEFFANKLDDFEVLQGIYDEVLALRNVIAQKNDSILAQKSLAKDIITGYNLLKSRITFTPTFATREKGEIFVEQLVAYVKLQEKFQAALSNKSLIAQNTKEIKSNKDCSNIVKAYELLIKSYESEANILTEGDLDKYMRQQQSIIKIQDTFLDVLRNGDKKDYDKRLKKEKNIDNIKLLLRID